MPDYPLQDLDAAVRSHNPGNEQVLAAIRAVNGNVLAVWEREGRIEDKLDQVLEAIAQLPGGSGSGTIIIAVAGQPVPRITVTKGTSVETASECVDCRTVHPFRVMLRGN